MTYFEVGSMVITGQITLLKRPVKSYIPIIFL